MHWLLPQGMEDLLPEEAGTLEQIRGGLLRLFDSWGYQLVVPPLVEHADALLSGLGSDLENQTFKLTDPVSGRTLGIRADITPQVARIDSCYMPQDRPARLCYLDNTLTAFPANLHSSRSPLQTGADLYGHSGIESDIEVICLMMATLNWLGLRSVCLDLGHVGIYRGLAEHAGLNRIEERQLFTILQKKSAAGLVEFLARLDISQEQKQHFHALMKLHGDQDVLRNGRRQLRGAGEKVHLALDNLTAIASEVERFLPGVQLYFDLAELRGYHYHTGVVFAAYSSGLGQAVAVGGRYDGAHGDTEHVRPATGFSADIKKLAPLSTCRRERKPVQVVGAPWGSDPDLHASIANLRSAGARVVNLLPGQQQVDDALTHYLEPIDGRWVLTPSDQA